MILCNAVILILFLQAFITGFTSFVNKTKSSVIAQHITEIKCF